MADQVPTLRDHLEQRRTERATKRPVGEWTAGESAARVRRPEPHPDPGLAAKGWQLCGCHDPGIYLRDSDHAATQAVPEREAG